MRAAVACFRALVMGGRDLALTARIGDDDHARSDPCKPPWAQHRHIDTDGDFGLHESRLHFTATFRGRKARLW